MPCSYRFKNKSYLIKWILSEIIHTCFYCFRFDATSHHSVIFSVAQVINIDVGTRIKSLAEYYKTKCSCNRVWNLHQGFALHGETERPRIDFGNPNFAFVDCVGKEVHHSMKPWNHLIFFSLTTAGTAGTTCSSSFGWSAGSKS